MKFFTKRKDGGPESTVTGYFLVEIKNLLTIALLRFEDGSRDAYHSHAFNSISWLLSGRLDEDMLWGLLKKHIPSLRPILTRREHCHRVFSRGRSWVLTFRGPWSETWIEYDPHTSRFTRLTHGRRIIG